MFDAIVARSLERPPARRRVRRERVVAGAVSVALAGFLGVSGTLSYAATALRDVPRTATHGRSAAGVLVLRGLTAGSDQYAPGYGFGDPEHNHDGPPGLSIDRTTAGDDAAAPAPVVPALPTRDALAKVVGANVSFDEQVHLYISVVGPGSRPLLLTQSSKRGGSKVGDALAGPQTKVIQYAVLIPRTIPIQLRVPANLLDPRATYRIRVVAVDPQGNRSTLLIPFRA